MISWIRDGIGLAALVAIGYGAGQVHPGAGWLIVGLIVLAGLVVTSPKGPEP